MRTVTLFLLSLLISACVCAGEPLDTTALKTEPESTVAERYEKTLTLVNIPEIEKRQNPLFALKISVVKSNSQAEAQGLKVGNLIVKLNGEPLLSYEAFQTHYRFPGENTVGVWTPETGEKSYTFTGNMGVVLGEDGRLDLAYLRGKDRNPAWDKALVVAANRVISDPEVARHALNAARKAGYAGKLLPLFSATIACGVNRYDEGLSQLSAVKSAVPIELTQTILGILFRSAVAAGRLDLAAQLEKDYPANNFRYRDWYLESLYARYKSLTASEREMIDGAGNLKRTVLRNGLKTPVGFNTDGKRAMNWLKRNPDGPVYGANNNPGYSSNLNFGRLTKNASLNVSFNFKDVNKTQPRRDPNGYFSFSLNDSMSSTEDPLVCLRCTQVGVAEVFCEGYPRIQLAPHLVHLEEDNDAEIVVDGPWFHIMLNGRKVFQGLTALRVRELHVRMRSYSAQGAITHFEYAELDPGVWQPVKLFSSPVKPVSIPKRPDQAELQWLYDVYVTGYVEHGRRSPAWDADAIEALALAARYTGRDTSVELTDIHSACKRAVEQGCDDPLVLKTYGEMIFQVEQHGAAAGKRLFRQAADSIENTQYNAWIKFKVLTEAAKFEYESDLDPLADQAATRVAAAAQLIHPIFAQSIPRWLVRDALIENFSLRRIGKEDHLSVYKPIIDALEQEPQDQSTALAFKGAVYIQYAWDARGRGWAKDVTPENWKLFGERLSIAKTALKKAWELDPTNGMAMEKMIWIAMNSDADMTVQDCFKNAMGADPNNLKAYDTVLQAMMPRWGGDVATLYKFGRGVFEMVRKNPTLNFNIANVLLTAHAHIIDEEEVGTTDDKSERALHVRAYWAKPEVWADVKDVFTLILERAPTNMEKSRYAYYAVKCKQYELACKLFGELGDNLVTAPFGGPAKARSEKAIAIREFRRQ